jgi:hypothetical protein
MVPELTFWVDVQPGPCISQRLCSDLDWDLKRRSGAVGNITYRAVHFCYPWICTHLPSGFNDVLGGCDRTWLEMHLEEMIVPTWRVSRCQFGATLGGCNRASLMMHLEAVIV